MSKPERFILTSDFPTLKNDSIGSVSVTFPGGQFLAANASVSFSSDIVAGTASSILRVRGSSSKESGIQYVGSMMTVTRLGSIGGPFAIPYTLLCYLSRVDAKTLRLTASAQNPYSSNMFLAVGDETFTFTFATFLSPFIQNN